MRVRDRSTVSRRRARSPRRMFDENSNAAGTTPVASSLAATPNANLMSQVFNVKDSRWLQVEVCREFLRGQCARSDQECKFAHPPPNVDVQQGRVTACYDSIKGRCTRENPKCKYLHPPQHIKDQLLINGRNHLALKNLLSAQINQGGNQMINPMLALQQQAAAVNLLPNTQMYPQYYNGMMYQQVLPDPYAAAAQGAVPVKRPALDKNGAMLFSPAAPQTPQFNPYLLQTLQGYVPTVSFSGQLPPRY
ncbi:hypothetical protein L5515_016546 [Caenorhabditis briggsae]|uniref:Muscleblind-like protein n=1 Tax=Caenorhabditis briggsae TaxID=6238 RepID=A0AAE9FCE3_CAEBR|nr:hypothetical protein L5515_016546 [Caenorhabditis briggsae]